MMRSLPVMLPLFSRPIAAFTVFLVFIAVADASATQLTIAPAPLGFSRVLVNDTKTLQVSLTNSGSTTITVSTVTNYPPGFSESNLNLPLNLPAGKTVTFNVTFAPTAVGLAAGNVMFLDNSSNILGIFRLRGVGVLPWMLRANPPSLNFGMVAVGGSRNLRVGLTNFGTSAITISEDSIATAGFSFTGLSLPLVIAAGQSFTFDIKFSPQATGAAGGRFLAWNATSPFVRIALMGTGVPGLTIAPGATDFGKVVEGTSLIQKGALSATGASVTVSSASIDDNGLFVLRGLVFPVRVPVGQTIPFTVTFLPVASGPVSASLSFVSDAGNSPTTEVLTGIGIRPYKVRLSWNASTSRVAGYNVYRRESHTKYKRINPALVASTTYTDRGVTTGTTYYYETKAVDSSGRESAPSNRATAVIP